VAQTVFILGAGASKAIGIPLMDEFIDAADDLRSQGASEVDRAAFDLVFDVIRDRLRLLHATSVVNLSNIEAVFSLIEMGSLVERLPGTSVGDLESIRAAIRTVLAQTIEQHCRFTYTEEGQWLPPESYLTLAGFVEKARETNHANPVSFLTFNYDLGLDFALHWSNLAIDYGLGPGADRAVPVLKLHGSLNWVSCPTCGAVHASSLGDLFAALPGRLTDRQAIQRMLPASRIVLGRPSRCPAEHGPRQLALVPPSWNKTQYHRAFGAVWGRAVAELAEASEIIVIGYSLPISDAFFRDLLALGLAGIRRLRRFAVVDPNSEVAARFHSLLGPECKDRFQRYGTTMADFVRSSYGQNPRLSASDA
jgi:hypothetical protein